MAGCQVLWESNQPTVMWSSVMSFNFWMKAFDDWRQIICGKKMHINQYPRPLDIILWLILPLAAIGICLVIENVCPEFDQANVAKSRLFTYGDKTHLSVKSIPSGMESIAPIISCRRCHSSCRWLHSRRSGERRLIDWLIRKSYLPACESRINRDGNSMKAVLNCGALSTHIDVNAPLLYLPLEIRPWLLSSVQFSSVQFILVQSSPFQLSPISFSYVGT